ncbi:MAG: hypothetical protein WDO24_18795 [Pseudomonadota bacterium]
MASVPEATVAVLQILASSGVLIWLDWRLASVALLGLPFSMIAPGGDRPACRRSQLPRARAGGGTRPSGAAADRRRRTVTRAFGLEAAAIERFAAWPAISATMPSSSASSVI